ncbi:MAG: hypothetical protein RBR35_18025, partial [Salinivirgaceae bacterium]|nr:hypothetical protein [Salinivirgaceae bacterium]
LFNLQRNTYVEKSPQEFDLKVLESEEELLRSHLRAESGQSLSLQRANELIRSFKLAWADGPKKRSAPENIMDAQWTGKNLSVFRIRLDNLSGVSGKGLCIAVHSVNGELSVCRVNEGDVALIQHLKDPVSGREFAACLASTFKIGLRDAETLAEHQIGQYYLQGLIAADKKGDIHEHSVEARSRI